MLLFNHLFSPKISHFIYYLFSFFIAVFRHHDNQMEICINRIGTCIEYMSNFNFENSDVRNIWVVYRKDKLFLHWKWFRRRELPSDYFGFSRARAMVSCYSFIFFFNFLFSFFFFGTKFFIQRYYCHSLQSKLLKKFK